MSRAGSLRDLYTPTLPGWSFNPPPGAPPASGPPAAPSASVYQWSTKPAQNSIFDLSPSLAFEPSATAALKALVASAFMQYSSSAIAMPWDVSKLLLQVQWVPRDAERLAAQPELVLEEEESEEEEDSNEEDDAYFANSSRPAKVKYPKPRPADERGYVSRRSVLEEGTRPEYTIPVGSADGVWSMIRRLGRFKNEGWFALWKGLLTSCIYDILSTTIQPLIHHSLQSLLISSTIRLGHSSLLLPLASHVFTGVLLSPLDLVRTRLIAQSSMDRHRTYSGPLDALGQISRDEGGIKSMYLHPQLLIPTVLDTALSSAVVLALPGALVRVFGGAHVGPDTHPLAWGAAEFSASCIGLLATLPIETVRRRLQVQTRGSARPLRTCVETRPAPYNGVVDTLWHILTEERSDLPIQLPTRRRRRSSVKGKEPEGSAAAENAAADNDESDFRDSWWKHTGLGQLYRGLGMRVGASAVVLLLGMVGVGEESELGWAEL